MRSFFKRLEEALLNILFPQPREIRKLEKMTMRDYYSSMERSEEFSSSIKAFFNYRDPLVRAAVWAVKYQSNSLIAERFGEILYEEIVGDLEDAVAFKNFSAPFLVPIPSSKIRRRKKGFNQTERLAEAIVRVDKAGFFEYQRNILVRIKDTIPQTETKNKRERRENPKGSFAVVNERRLEGRNVILIDDVVTTGSTLEEAMRTLKRAGAKRVIAYAIAH